MTQKLGTELNANALFFLHVLENDSGGNFEKELV